MELRRAVDADWPAIWAILGPVFLAGDTYAVEAEIPEPAARAMWMDLPAETWVAAEAGAILGTYYIKRNQSGGGGHVCNCGYVTAEAARRRGLARAMCVQSQDRARALGFAAMQFNFVVASNVGAIALWRRLGFEEVGRLPQAFRHPEAGLVDALVMYKWLGPEVGANGF